MRDFAILIIQILGYTMILGFFVSIVNFYFDLRLGIYDVEVPGDPDFAVIILILGLIVSGIGYWLGKKFPTPEK